MAVQAADDGYIPGIGRGQLRPMGGLEQPLRILGRALQREGNAEQGIFFGDVFSLYGIVCLGTGNAGFIAQLFRGDVQVVLVLFAPDVVVVSVDILVEEIGESNLLRFFSNCK